MPSIINEVKIGTDEQGAWVEKKISERNTTLELKISHNTFIFKFLMTLYGVGNNLSLAAVLTPIDYFMYKV